MHLQITNKTTLALDAFRFSFGSAGALELHNEYSGLATEAAPNIAFAEFRHARAWRIS